MNLKKTLDEYYSKRAKEYDEIYKRPDKIRLKEQKLLAEYIVKIFKRRSVLEVACGTGYWTKYLLKSAKKVLATDYSSKMLEISSNGLSNRRNITFVKADAYDLPVSFPKYNGAMANFWFSHIPKSKITEFLDGLHLRLEPKSVVLFADGVYREELGGELLIKDKRKDTYKRRTLKSGEQFDILKNYFSKKELEKIFSKYSNKIQIEYLSHFWIVKYTI